MKSWTIAVEEDPETKELVLPLCDEIMEELGWKLDDTLDWIDNKDGTWTLKKYEDN